MEAEKRTEALEKAAEKVLEISHLSVSFGGLKAVDDLSFSIERGQIYGLIGPNGAGKTTVFNCITQFYKPDAGSILFTGKDGKTHELTRLPVHKVIRLGLVRTFQNTEIIRDLTVIDNLLLGAHCQFTSGVASDMLRVPWARKQEKTMRAKALEVLRYIGLERLAEESAAAQPYGVLKLIEFGRTLLCNPSLIILDEPAAGLNESETQTLMELIRGVSRDYHCSVLVVEHDMRLVMGICDRICAISFGRMLAEGVTSYIQQHPAVQDAYLGKEEA
jgi:branched-chain amino acid transport system ATP-binding protein